MRLAREPLSGTIGIGHTRWATHGRPTENNAHPHATEKLAVVHNGIIENFSELRRELEAKGAKFATETDTEVVAHLVTEEMKRGASPVEAVKAALPRLRGAFALAFLFAGEDNLLIGARKGSPLAHRLRRRRDVCRLRRHCARAVHRHGQLSRGRRLGHRHAQGRRDPRRRRRGRRARRAQVAGLGHAASTRATIAISWPRRSTSSPRSSAIRWRIISTWRPSAWRCRWSCRSISASSTASRSPPAARPITPAWSRDIGSNVSPICRSRSISPPSSATATSRSSPGNLAIFVSQSGETADTLASLRYAREHKQHVLSIVNVPTSTIARESDIVMPTLAGPEIGVASTKAFTCQLAALAALAIAAGRARGVLAQSDEKRLVHALIEVPRHHGRGAGARAADRAARPRSRQMPRRALSRPRHQLPDRARRRAQAQGNLLHPCRGLCGGRTQARPDRADRREHAGDRDRAARPGVREDRLQHAGSRRARRPADPGDRREGRAGRRQAQRW